MKISRKEPLHRLNYVKAALTHLVGCLKNKSVNALEENSLYMALNCVNRENNAVNALNIEVRYVNTPPM